MPKLKLKGAYWYPEKFPEDISSASPPAWHKDYSALVTIKAAVAHMVHGADIAQFVYSHTDPFDFMCRCKVTKGCKLFIGDREVQRTTRYYLATNGGPMRKVSPPAGPEGEFKRAPKVDDATYYAIRNTIPPGTHDPRIHTKNKSRYETRESSIEAGHLVAECNDVRSFDWENLNRQWYIDHARKLVIPT